MASVWREERLEQRLRGSQKRQVKDVDFGLTFPAAVAAEEPAAPSGSPPPEAPLPAQPSYRRTPAQRAKASAILPGDIIPVAAHIANDANTSAKRRKLDSDGTPSSSSRATRSSQRTRAPRPDIYALPEEDVEDTSIGGDTSTGSIVRAQVAATPEVEVPIPEATKTGRTPIAALRAADEVTESPHDAPGSGQRLRAKLESSQLASSQLQMIQNDSFISSIDTPQPHRKRKREVAVKSTPLEGSSRKRRLLTRPNPEDDDLDELSPEQPVRRGREKHSPELEDPSLPEAPEEVEEAEAINDDDAAAVLEKNRGRRISRNAREESVDLDSSAVLKSPPKKKPKRQTQVALSPAKQRQPKQSAAQSKPPTFRKSSKRTKVRAGSPIPVTVHRLNRPLIFDEDELDADILNLAIPHTKRAGVNAIDVLSQICQEIVTSGMDTLEEGGNNCQDPALRREYKTKWNAVASFGTELQNRLLQHTINLDNAYSLERRVRDEQKKKLNLREEILRVRAEREQVALRMDEIRIRHEKEKKEAVARDNLNITIHDIELAVDLGKGVSSEDSINGSDLVGIELLLKRVAGEVSNKHSSGGQLRQIKEYNAFLERAALALENRRF